MMLEAEEKSIEAFRERAIGDKATLMLKDLKNRLREEIKECRMENIKKSQEELKRYVKKYVEHLGKKLSSDQIKSYSEFEKETTAIFERIFNEGPKLHTFKEVYMEAWRKFLTQGATFLFRKAVNEHEKNSQILKQKENQLKGEVQRMSEEKEAIRKKYLDSTS